jgi:hypothetical protein
MNTAQALLNGEKIIKYCFTCIIILLMKTRNQYSVMVALDFLSGIFREIKKLIMLAAYISLVCQK